MSENARELFSVLENIPKDKLEEAVALTSAFLKGVEVGMSNMQLQKPA